METRLKGVVEIRLIIEAAAPLHNVTHTRSGMHSLASLMTQTESQPAARAIENTPKGQQREKQQDDPSKTMEFALQSETKNAVADLPSTIAGNATPLRG